MQNLANSTFLQILGHAMIQSLWQFALAWLVYCVVNVLFTLNATQRYLIALFLNSAGFSWFLFTLVSYAPPPIPLLATTDLITNDSLFQTINGWLLNKEALMPYLAATYLLVLIIFILKWIASYRHSCHIKETNLKKINVEWRLFTDRLAMQMSIKNKVKIYLSDIVDSPLTIGFLKPVILIPLATLNHLNTEQMEAVILHELAHIKRHDYFINLLISLSEVVLFFNPFMHLISREIKKERENCCDDWVLQFNYCSTVYANALLAIAVPKTKTSLALYASDKKQLLARIIRIIEPQQKAQYSFKHFLMACCTTGLFAGIMAAPTQRSPVAQKNISQSVINEKSNVVSIYNDIALEKKNRTPRNLRSVETKRFKRRNSFALAVYPIKKHDKELGNFVESKLAIESADGISDAFKTILREDQSPIEFNFATHKWVIQNSSDSSYVQTDKLIIIELPANPSDSSAKQIIYNGKVLKVTKI